MKRFTFKHLGLFSTLVAASLAAQAIEKPVLTTRTLTSGEKYVLVNPANPTGYMSRTSWDGAFYFLGADDSNYANHQLQAVDNGDGTWSFTMTTEPAEEGAEATVTYLGIPGSANLNMLNDVAVWTVENGSIDGYYWLKAGEGNNANSIGHYLHLNSGMQYFVLSFPGDSWYPDFPTKTDADGNRVEDPVTGFVEMSDSTSLNWGFMTVDDMAQQMPLFATRTEVYNNIVNYEDTYLLIDEYAAGFKVGADAAAAIYENPAFEVAWKDSVNAIISAKVALYEEIEKALELNLDGNATLTAATQAAKAVFDASAKADELESAKVELVKAEAAYSQGQGDLTSLGKNMSFEDLSAQGGNTTTGVADAPYGWNLIISGDTCKTAAEIQSHGVTAWCGVNADCSGETKDGNYGFGIWTSGFPSVEISQTITGLENGTYEISAALMVAANGNGSRRTTQRIFGNLNATYFGAEEEYNLTLLDDSEVATFAGLVENTYDEKDMYPISVRAYVYDGTLTLGLRTDGNVKAAKRESSNQGGGDGWFKIDNFRIAAAEYDVNDALTVLKHYIDLLDECQWGVEALPEATYTLLDESIQKYQAVNASSSREVIDATIAEAVALLKQVTPEVEAYIALQDALNEALVNLEAYRNMPGATAFEAVISDIQNDFYDGVYDIDGTVAAIAELEAAFEACKKSEIKVGQDITNLLVNPSFENQAATQPGGDTGGIADAPKGWTLILDGDTCRTAAEISDHGIANWCSINSGDPIEVTDDEGNVIYKQPTDGEKLWGIWTPKMPEVELSQTLTGLPKGTYTLKVDVMVQNNWAGDNITTQRIFGNKFIQMFSYDGVYAMNLPEDAQWGANADMNIPDEEYDFVTYARYTCESGDATTSLLRPMSVKFVVDESGVATVGFRTNGINPDGMLAGAGGRDGQGWFKVDNFRLTYDSEVVPDKLAQDIDTEVVEAEVVSRQYFTLGGLQTDAAQKGFIIVKSTLSDGSVKVSKMLVK